MNDELFSWDTRDESYQPIHHVKAHSLEVNCVEFSPGNEWILATGSSDKVNRKGNIGNGILIEYRQLLFGIYVI